MTLRYYTHNELPITRVMDDETGFVAATSGNQPKDFVPEHWTDNGEPNFIKAQQEVATIFEKPQDDKMSLSIYKSALKAGHSKEVARQLSGYSGK